MPKELTKEFLHKEFIEKEKSTSQIAKEVGTHPNTVRRALIKHGYALRDKSEAQRLALANKTAKHPTAGRKRTEEEKAKICTGTYEYWQNISASDKAKWCKMKQAEWKELSEEEKDKRYKLAAKAIRETVSSGSRLERYLVVELRERGYRVEFHKENFLLNTKLQTDLLLPNDRIVIEIDGISHYEPIYGQEKLEKQKRADAEKNGLLLANGFHIIRLKAVYRTLAKDKKKEYLALVLTALEKLKKTKSPTIVHI